MTGSTNSLEPLSSPSPSRSPSPAQKTAEPTSAGLDSDSELSELTEEEQETEKLGRKKGSAARGTRGSLSTRGLRSPRRGGRRKRSSLVPAPMWGWAESKTANVVEEEEEEESAGPPRPMEEEEGPEEEEEDPVQPEISDDEANRDDTDDDDEELDKIDDPKIDDPKPALAPAMSVLSIMGGAVTIQPASPSPSASSASSRSASPERLSVNALDPTGDDSKSVDETNGDDLVLGRTDEHPPKGKKPMEIQIPDPDLDTDIVVDENSLDDDMEAEQESELQPAHRAEALDVLAVIELKFALLRERIYLEKMEGLAWEESLVLDGSHPELLHLHRELSKRKEKRLDLATARRKLELDAVSKKRRLNEEATWNWWRLARDDLQTEMIAETNRKRRKLERDRRTVERPQPVRRMPEVPVDVPPAPTLFAIAKSYPFGGHLNNRDELFQPLVHPELSTLSRSEISQDLDALYSHRSTTYDPRANIPNQAIPNVPLIAPPIGYESYNDTFPPSMPGGNRAMPASMAYHSGPPVPHGPGQAYAAYPNGPPGARLHQPSGGSVHPPGPHGNIHTPSAFTIEQEMEANGNAPPYYFGHGGNPGSYPPQVQQHNIPGRRSVSPPNTGKSNGQWMGPGMGMGGYNTGPTKGGGDWIADSRRSGGSYPEEEDRERINRDRDRRDRDPHDTERAREAYHMQAMQQHRHPSVHMHGTSSQHHHGSHHHHHGRSSHHHHHVVHHHPTNASGNGPATANNHHGSHPTEMINHGPSKGSWNEDGPEYRDNRSKHPPSRFMNGIASAPPEERERPLPVPFTMAPSHNMRSPPRQSKGNVSPRWNPSDDGFRIPHDSRPHSPSRFSGPSHAGRPAPQQPMRQNSLGHSPPHHSRIPPPPSPSSSARSPTRYRERSPPPGLKIHRMGSPPPSSKVALPPPGSMSGPGRTSTPTAISSMENGPTHNGRAISPREPGFGSLLGPGKVQTVDNHP